MRHRGWWVNCDGARRWRLPLLWLMLLGALLSLPAVGCGSAEPALVPIRGKVFYRNHPLTGGTIVFTPDASMGASGPQAWAEIGPDGSFTLQSDGKPGAVPGWHRITIAGARGARLPARYRDPDRSDQRYEVRPGGADECLLNLE